MYWTELFLLLIQKQITSTSIVCMENQLPNQALYLVNNLKILNSFNIYQF